MTSSVSFQPRYRFLLPTLLLFLVVFVGGVFYLKPLADDVGSLAAGLTDKKTQRDKYAKQLGDLQALQQSLNLGSEVNQQNTLNAIPENFQQDKLITDLKQIAQGGDMVLNNLNFSLGGNSTDIVKRATVTANLTGSEDSLLVFLKGVESNARKIIVKSVTVQLGQTSGVPRVNFTVSMETYYQSNF